jgi:serine/threonine-protein kinase
VSSPAENPVPSELPVVTGQVLDGKFRVERIIGEGAFGLVVEARHLQLDERVALKFLRPEARARPDIAMRFAREARSAAKIRSDHVARVFDVGGADGGAPFIVMEFLEGQDLEARLAKGGALPIAEACEYVIQACEGLAAAHTRGIVHRDIKPGNLFVTDDGGIPRVKLVDFGISKAGISISLEDVDLQSVDTTQIMGSPHYMSPEQIRSTKDVDGRADIWSLGVVLFELITGKPPFYTATELTGIIAQVLHEPHPPLQSLRGDAPTALSAVVDRCLQKDVAQRYQNAAELAVALLPFAPKRARGVVERANAITNRASGSDIPVDSLPPPMPMPQRVSSTSPSSQVVLSNPTLVTPEAPAGRTLGVVLGAALVVLLFASGAFALWSRSRGAAAPTEPPAASTPAPRATATPTPPPAPMPSAQPTAEPAAAASSAPVATTTATAAKSAAAPTTTPPHPATAAPVVGRPSAQPQPRPRGSAATPENEIRLER